MREGDSVEDKEADFDSDPVSVREPENVREFEVEREGVLVDEIDGDSETEEVVVWESEFEELIEGEVVRDWDSVRDSETVLERDSVCDSLGVVDKECDSVCDSEGV